MQGTQYATKRSILCRGAFCGPTEHAYSNLNYLCNINEIGYPLRPLSSAHKTIQQILYTQCQTNIMDTWTQIQSISRYSRRGVRGTIDLSII